MKIPASAFTAAHNLGRMAGDIFRGAKGVAQSGVLLPVAARSVVLWLLVVSMDAWLGMKIQHIVEFQVPLVMV